MARSKKDFEPGVWHYITMSTVGRQPLFTTVSRVRALQGRLNRARKRYVLLCAAYVIMPDHLHWLIYPTEAGYEDFAVRQIQRRTRWADDPARHYLPRIVDDVKRGTTTEIRGLERSLPPRIWQSGFWDRPVMDIHRLPNIVNNIHQNPVRAGLCEHPADYPYSSYCALVLERPHIVVLDHAIWENLNISPTQAALQG